jgi:hypothetical protein
MYPFWYPHRVYLYAKVFAAGGTARRCGAGYIASMNRLISCW